MIQVRRAALVDHRAAAEAGAHGVFRAVDRAAGQIGAAAVQQDDRRGALDPLELHHFVQIGLDGQVRRRADARHRLQVEGPRRLAVHVVGHEDRGRVRAGRGRGVGDREVAHLARIERRRRLAGDGEEAAGAGDRDRRDADRRQARVGDREGLLEGGVHRLQAEVRAVRRIGRCIAHGDFGVVGAAHREARNLELDGQIAVAVHGHHEGAALHVRIREAGVGHDELARGIARDRHGRIEELPRERRVGVEARAVARDFHAERVAFRGADRDAAGSQDPVPIRARRRAVHVVDVELVDAPARQHDVRGRQGARRRARRHPAGDQQVADGAGAGQTAAGPDHVGGRRRGAVHDHDAFVDHGDAAVRAGAGQGQLVRAVLLDRTGTRHVAGIGGVVVLPEDHLAVVDDVALQAGRRALQGAAGNGQAHAVGGRSAQDQQARTGFGQVAVGHVAGEFHPLRDGVADGDRARGAAEIDVAAEVQRAGPGREFAERDVALQQQRPGNVVVRGAGGLHHHVVAEDERGDQAQGVGAADADFAGLEAEPPGQAEVVARQGQAAGTVLDEGAVAVRARAGEIAAQPQFGRIGRDAHGQRVGADGDGAAGHRRIAGRLETRVAREGDGTLEVHVVLDEAQRAAAGHAGADEAQRLRREVHRVAAAMQFQGRAVGHDGARAGRAERVGAADLQRALVDRQLAREGVVVAQQDDPAFAAFPDGARARNPAGDREVPRGGVGPGLVGRRDDVGLDGEIARRARAHADTAGEDRQHVAAEVHVRRRAVHEAHGFHRLVAVQVDHRTGAVDAGIEEDRRVRRRQGVAVPVEGRGPVAVVAAAAIPDRLVGHRFDGAGIGIAAGAGFGRVRAHAVVIGDFRQQAGHHEAGAAHGPVRVAAVEDAARIEQVRHRDVHHAGADAQRGAEGLQPHLHLVAVVGAQIERFHRRQGRVDRRPRAHVRPRRAVVRRDGHGDAVAEVAVAAAAEDARAEGEGFARPGVEIERRGDQRGDVGAQRDVAGGLDDVRLDPGAAGAFAQHAVVVGRHVGVVTAQEGRVRADVEPVAARAGHRRPVGLEGRGGNGTGR